jgi:hypothetical protein
MTQMEALSCFQKGCGLALFFQSRQHSHLCIPRDGLQNYFQCRVATINSLAKSKNPGGPVYKYFSKDIAFSFSSFLFLFLSFFFFET